METRVILRSVLLGAALAAAAIEAGAQSLALPPVVTAPSVPSSAPSVSAQTVPPAPAATTPPDRAAVRSPESGVRRESVAQQAAAIPPVPATTTPPVGVQVTARSTATMAAPMPGQIVEFPAADGDAIKQGQVLVRFNCAQQEATVARAHAELVKRQDLMSTQKSLKALNAYSKSDFLVAQNDVEVAKADLDLAKTAVDNCVIHAPFNGRVANAPVRNYQFVQAGAPLLDIVDDRDLELEFIVPSVWLVWLKVGADSSVQVAETQKTYDAKITRISGKVDAASQTIKIYGHIEGDTTDLLPGMSGVAHFAGVTH
jgi:membrane fusion protein, multidrug efflux system